MHFRLVVFLLFVLQLLSLTTFDAKLSRGGSSCKSVYQICQRNPRFYGYEGVLNRNVNTLKHWYFFAKLRGYANRKQHLILEHSQKQLVFYIKKKCDFVVPEYCKPHILFAYQIHKKNHAAIKTSTIWWYSWCQY